MPASGMRVKESRRRSIREISLSASFRSPKWMLWVGHTDWHAVVGVPFSIRCTQNVHLSTVPDRGSTKRASYGHAAMHALQPVHLASSTSTMPPGPT